MSVDDFGGDLEKAFHIEHTLFDLRVAISRLTKETKKEPTLQAFGMPLMGGVNLPRIEVPTFDGAILKFQPF